MERESGEREFFFEEKEKNNRSSFTISKGMTASNEQAPSAPAQPPTLFADPLIPTAACKLVAQGAEAVSETSPDVPNEYRKREREKERKRERETCTPSAAETTRNEKKKKNSSHPFPSDSSFPSDSPFRINQSKKNSASGPPTPSWAAPPS